MIQSHPTKTSISPFIMNLSVYTTQDFKSLYLRQKIAFSACMSGDNVFITGGGGVGKTHLIKSIERHIPNVVLCASIGIAARDIGGQTIDRFMGFRVGIQTPKQVRVMQPYIKARLEKVTTLLIDEIGTIRCDKIDMINERLQSAKGNNLPFGGVQLILLGDFCQMKPIVPTHGLIAKYLKETYQNKVFAFESDAWKSANIQCHVLDEYYRQENMEQARVLRLLRVGKHIDKVVRKINAMTQKNQESEHDIVLCTTNKQVDKINEERYSKLKGEEFIYRGTGDLPKDPLNVPSELKLKVGALVMMCANNVEMNYYNGDLGVVAKLNKKNITVMLNGGGSVDIEPFEWEEIEQDFSNGKLTRSVVGTYTQFPIRLSYALTIHKSQGITLDGASIDFSNGTFNEGQAYVGLSRPRNFDKLYLKRPLRVSDIKYSTLAIEFTIKASYAAIERLNDDLARFPHCA